MTKDDSALIWKNGQTLKVKISSDNTLTYDYLNDYSDTSITIDHTIYKGTPEDNLIKDKFSFYHLLKCKVRYFIDNDSNLGTEIWSGSLLLYRSIKTNISCMGFICTKNRKLCVVRCNTNHSETKFVIVHLGGIKTLNDQLIHLDIPDFIYLKVDESDNLLFVHGFNSDHTNKKLYIIGREIFLPVGLFKILRLSDNQVVSKTSWSSNLGLFQVLTENPIKTISNTGDISSNLIYLILYEDGTALFHRKYGSVFHCRPFRKDVKDIRIILCKREKCNTSYIVLLYNKDREFSFCFCESSDHINDRSEEFRSPFLNHGEFSRIKSNRTKSAMI